MRGRDPCHDGSCHALQFELRRGDDERTGPLLLCAASGHLRDSGLRVCNRHQPRTRKVDKTSCDSACGHRPCLHAYDSIHPLWRDRHGGTPLAGPSARAAVPAKRGRQAFDDCVPCLVAYQPLDEEIPGMVLRRPVRHDRRLHASDRGAEGLYDEHSLPHTGPCHLCRRKAEAQIHLHRLCIHQRTRHSLYAQRELQGEEDCKLRLSISGSAGAELAGEHVARRDR